MVALNMADFVKQNKQQNNTHDGPEKARKYC